MTAMSVSEMNADIMSGKTTAEQLVQRAFDSIAAHDDPALFITLRERDEVLAEARERDAGVGSVERGPLHGIPFAAKDNIDCAGLPTTAACPAFAYVPVHDAPVVARLRSAGAILLGKTNLDQFATGLVGTRSPYGVPRNVWDESRVPGGSSSGSAAAVAAGIVPFSLGTDTAGSGRVPAGFNGIVGLKPSRGRLSIRGVVPACRTLDCVSVFAQTTQDASLLLNVVEGHDPDDPYSSADLAEVSVDRGKPLGVLPDSAIGILSDTYAKSYRAACARIDASGIRLKEIDFAPFRAVAELLYGGAFVAERLIATRALLSDAPDALDATVRSILHGATTQTALGLFENQHQLRVLAPACTEQLESISALMVPTAPGHPTLAEVAADPLGTNAQLGAYTNFVNLLDLAAVAVPAGVNADATPFGVTLIAAAGSDRDLLHLAEEFGWGRALERAVL